MHVRFKFWYISSQNQAKQQREMTKFKVLWRMRAHDRKFPFFHAVEPRLNEPLYNELLGITNDILQPGQSYSKMYGTEPRYNEPRYDEILITVGIVTSTIQKPKRKTVPRYNE